MELFCEDEKTAYYASADGEVWSLHKTTGRWFELKPGRNRNGYCRFLCCQNGLRKNIYIHRAVFEAFNGPIPHGLQINHRNCKRDDNRLENLELVTPSQNHLHPPTREHSREAMRWKMKPVQDMTTGKIYESTSEASRQTGLNSGSILKCCNGKRNTVGGHTFKFVS